MADSKAKPIEVVTTPEELAEELASPSRRARQAAAAELAKLSRTEPETLLPFIDVLVDALQNSEARTRWESLDALTNMVALDSVACFDALELAEEALFDENNGTVRLAAMRFVCKMGCVSLEYASEVWPLIDEALRCYHGDPEYIDMLVAVNEYSLCPLPEEARNGLVVRMGFDANNPKSGLVKRAKAIIAAASGEITS